MKNITTARSKPWSHMKTDRSLGLANQWATGAAALAPPPQEVEKKKSRLLLSLAPTLPAAHVAEVHRRQLLWST